MLDGNNYINWNSLQLTNEIKKKYWMDKVKILSLSSKKKIIPQIIVCVVMGITVVKKEIQIENEQELNSDLYLSNAIILIIRLHT